MDKGIIYIIILGITVVSYLLGLFLSYFEKKGKISVLSEMGNVGFVNIYGVNMPTPEQLYRKKLEENMAAHPDTFMNYPSTNLEDASSYMDDEII